MAQPTGSRYLKQSDRSDSAAASQLKVKPSAWVKCCGDQHAHLQPRSESRAWLSGALPQPARAGTDERARTQVGDTATARVLGGEAKLSGCAEAAPKLQRNSAAPTSLPEQGVLRRLFRWPKYLPPRMLLVRRNLRGTKLSLKAFSTIKPPLPAPTFGLQYDLHKYKTQTLCTLGSGAQRQNHRQDWNKRLRRGGKESYKIMDPVF